MLWLDVYSTNTKCSWHPDSQSEGKTFSKVFLPHGKIYFRKSLSTVAFVFSSKDQFFTMKPCEEFGKKAKEWNILFVTKGVIKLRSTYVKCTHPFINIHNQLSLQCKQYKIQRNPEKNIRHNKKLYICSKYLVIRWVQSCVAVVYSILLIWSPTRLVTFRSNYHWAHLSTLLAAYFQKSERISFLFS